MDAGEGIQGRGARDGWRTLTQELDFAEPACCEELIPSIRDATTLFRKFVSLLQARLSGIGVSQDRVDHGLQDWKFVFILGFGRSGTAFLANFIDGTPGVHVYHEPVFEDFFAHARAHYDADAAREYMQGFRKREVYLRMRAFNPGTYGEVNSVLRCHAKAIRTAFPGATLIHLVRDGRDVVRSAMPRRAMTFRDPLSLMIHPQDPDPWRSRWSKMDRFARICWYWQEENRRLRLAIGNPVQFEKLLVDYDYFTTQILEPCGAIRIGREVWESAVASPRNITREFSMPRWEAWTPEQQRVFSEICGEEMEKCGYSF